MLTLKMLAVVLVLGIGAWATVGWQAGNPQAAQTATYITHSLSTNLLPPNGGAHMQK